MVSLPALGLVPRVEPRLACAAVLRQAQDEVVFAARARPNRRKASMQLVGSPTSPYVRKVRVYLEETGARYEFAPADAWRPDARLLGMAPLGKVPVLVRDDGSALFDSLLVIEYLDHTLPEARRLIPATGEARWDVL